MKYISGFGKKLEHLCRGYLPTKRVFSICHFLKASMAQLFHYMVFHVIPFWLQLCYFLIVSLVGYLALKVSKPRGNNKVSDFDLFFTSVSATTVSSMSIVEMEVFSNKQLIVMTVLMLLGGEVFISVLHLQLQKLKMMSSKSQINQLIRDNSCSRCKVDSVQFSSDPTSSALPADELGSLELGIITCPPPALDIRDEPRTPKFLITSGGEVDLKYNCTKSLGYVVLGYLLLVLVFGSSLISTYIGLTPSANNVLKSKGLVLQTFSVFTTVSTFTNCGFVPTNENMIVFRKNPGLLWILIPQILLGNTLYSPCLRLVLYVLERFTKRKEYGYMLANYQELGYGQFVSSKESWFMASTNIVFIIVQFVMFSVMEWSSGAMEGMSSYEKIVGSLFQTTNSRHTGESIVDLSVVSSAILVLFVLMMYLPPSISFLPIGDQRAEASKNNKSSKRNFIENMLFSQLSYLVIFVIVICITERQRLKEDPLNFNVLNIVIEVISAYGNVGFSTGYSCKRRLKLDEYCEDKWYGFAGRWSKEGQIALILVMFFGRLKKFNMQGGKAWKLS